MRAFLCGLCGACALCLLCVLCVPVASAQAPVTFSKDIAPILYTRCATCHHPNGSAPFSLLSYEAVRPRATLIAAATSRGFMPPWKADRSAGEFVGQARLTPHEIDLLRFPAQWDPKLGIHVT